jgi:hypothetical protein
MAGLVIPLEMLSALDQDDAVEWLRALQDVVPTGSRITVVGIDRDRVKQHPTVRRRAGPVGRWRATEPVIAGLFEAAGWRWVSTAEAEEPWLLEVSATR